MSVEPLHKFPLQQYDVPVYKLVRLKEPCEQLVAQPLKVPDVLTKKNVNV
jgi:hypothetical protein